MGSMGELLAELFHTNSTTTAPSAVDTAAPSTGINTAGIEFARLAKKCFEARIAYTYNRPATPQANPTATMSTASCMVSAGGAGNRNPAWSGHRGVTKVRK